MSRKKRVSHKLVDVVHRELVGIGVDKDHQTADWGGELSEEMLDYAAKDTKVLTPLVEAFEPRVNDAGLEKVLQIEHRALPAMVRIANTGVPFDSQGWQEHLEELEEEKARLEGRLAELAPDHPDGRDWNWRSPQQQKAVFKCSAWS